MLTETDAAAPPVIFTSTVRGPLVFLLVGAGGTGARVMGPLSQIARRGDTILVMDDDIVEDRNLLRQHFTARDIGRPKAQVLAERYRREGVSIVPLLSRLQVGDPQAILTHLLAVTDHAATALIMLGCVDNAAARRAMQDLVSARHLQLSSGSAWIDVGNEMRGGQVLLTLQKWIGRVQVTDHDLTSESLYVTLPGLAMAMPQLLRDPVGEGTIACGERIDLQTVQVNHLASACALNVVSWLLLGLPIVNAGVFFSTLNSMQPIPLIGIVPRTQPAQLIPSTAFAVSA